MWMEVMLALKETSRKEDPLQNNTLWIIPLDSIGREEYKRRLGMYALIPVTACAWKVPYVQMKSSVTTDP